MDYAISIKNLTKKFGNFTAVDNISFNIPKGKIFGFLGPNGSGKSTTIRMICGVLRPTCGEGRVLGYDLIKESEKIKQNIGYMSQKFSLYEDLTVEENLDFYGNIYMLDKETLEFRKKELIKMANLEGKEKSIAGTLSGGWKQRLALGCSLIHNPQLLILDEPTAGVDPVSRRDFWNTIIDLVKEGMTVLVTTHYMDEASVCDIIGFIYNGKLVTIDSIDNLYKKHKINNLEDIFIKYVKKFSNKEVVASFDDLKSLKNKEEE
ncbi:ABC transporter ATP-binding protein [Clostridium sp. cel8]|jgi:ABC-2 type transport system ATP-binding protein|uniref:ABC transporter ATP-binding protein n=1 Tax=Clostridium sp. cel8 TaxID=2663123 RepID=UPI0015F4338A|nr:ABC transporter ATP-binding protein [Clostridium sp. cel8]MBA5851182.1 ABC transporter ATP-binding protein [Clostridium sp. cel8]